MPADAVKVSLVSMPWAIFNRPSIQLGALQSYIHAHEPSITVATHYPYLEAAQAIGLDTYRIISEDIWAGEALYCSLLFPEMEKQAQSVFHSSLGKKTTSTLPVFKLLREQLDRQLNKWLEGIDFSDVDLIGFSVCFGQLPATLLATQRLKQEYPQLPIVLGGSTCIPKTGASLLSIFPEVDFVITGEGEQPLLGLCRYLSDTAESLPHAVLCRNTENSSRTPQASLATANEVDDLNALPAPEYSDYFAQLKLSGLGFIPQLPLEFSRGCWWNKCAFCNLNLQWCGYRFKKWDRLRKEVELLVTKYHCLDFFFTDNALPPAEADSFFTAMQNSTKDIHFFAEIRTINKPGQYEKFRRGGLNSVQIGIEAFSNSLLQKMNKGTTVLDNFAAMKNCAENNIRLDGNLIVEFPGSTKEEVLETLHALDFALPFNPLAAAGFFLGLGSPVWKESDKYGIRSIRHHPYNKKLYPDPILQRLDLLIKQGTGDRVQQKALWQPVRHKIKEWAMFHEKRKQSGPALSYRAGNDFIIIRQERPGLQTRQHRLTGTSAKIYIACKDPISIKSLLQNFNSVTEKVLTVFLGDLENKKLIFRDGDMYMALAVKQSATIR